MTHNIGVTAYVRIIPYPNYHHKTNLARITHMGKNDVLSYWWCPAQHRDKALRRIMARADIKPGDIFIVSHDWPRLGDECDDRPPSYFEPYTVEPQRDSNGTQ